MPVLADPAEMPPAIARLPRQPGTGYPIPWFVATVNGHPDFRVMDPDHARAAIKQSRCLMCGGLMLSMSGNARPPATFVIGPMCTVNRTSAEPPHHWDCADYAARVCPFLSQPERVRREAGLPEERHMPGVGILRNPGVTCVWRTRNWFPRQVPNGILWDIGDAHEWRWYCQGRAATRDEVIDSMREGLPQLAAIAQKQGPAAMQQFNEDLAACERYLPPAEPEVTDGE